MMRLNRLFHRVRNRWLRFVEDDLRGIQPRHDPRVVAWSAGKRTPTTVYCHKCERTFDISEASGRCE